MILLTCLLTQLWIYDTYSLQYMSFFLYDALMDSQKITVINQGKNRTVALFLYIWFLKFGCVPVSLYHIFTSNDMCLQKSHEKSHT